MPTLREALDGAVTELEQTKLKLAASRALVKAKDKALESSALDAHRQCRVFFESCEAQGCKEARDALTLTEADMEEKDG